MTFIMFCKGLGILLVLVAILLFTQRLFKFFLEYPVEVRNKKVRSRMLNMGWQQVDHGLYWNSYSKGEFHLDSFWPDPEQVIEKAKKVDEGVKAGARVLSQYMNIIEGKK